MTVTNSPGTRYLSFSVGAEEYAVPLLVVKEVIAMPDITPIPFSPAYFLGIMNLRGQVISVVDLRARLGIKAQSGAETGVIICDLGATSLGVVVDSINSVVSPKEGELSPKPEVSAKNSDYIEQVYRKDKSLILLIDIARALGVQDLALAARAAA